MIFTIVTNWPTVKDGPSAEEGRNRWCAERSFFSPGACGALTSCPFGRLTNQPDETEERGTLFAYVV